MVISCGFLAPTVSVGNFSVLVHFAGTCSQAVLMWWHVTGPHSLEHLLYCFYMFCLNGVFSHIGFIFIVSFVC